jgi:hypothetical protein
LAVFFLWYSIELAVDDVVRDQGLDQMSRGEQWDVYRRAADKSRATLAQATSLLTLKLHGKHVPVRVVDRGQERFVGWVDEAQRPQ